MTDEDMIALSYYHSSAYDPRQLDFMMQVGKPPLLESGQYLQFPNTRMISSLETIGGKPVTLSFFIEEHLYYLASAQFFPVPTSTRSLVHPFGKTSKKP
uniref:Uncharacterized protein n=1 Tax=Candidatus Kentrum sp. SD TaxID=2126332 RepID=A0A450YZS7_9GAMM|nr:MAG: hypothetical protein BECKSD772F_GA0070984_13522 [Candidatus Kentron sp. SD]VFK49755.1 MAG: hypothetical protein BECKSD772E_GA0070983_12314 [Candidatus Kentron sp. SD]